MSDFQDNAPVQLKPIKACAQIIEQRNRYREAVKAYRSEVENPVPDQVMTRLRRQQLFALLGE